MDHLVLANVPPYDGRYEFDLDGSSLTVREWGWIKRLSGYMPLTVDDGLAGADPELFAVFAAIALRRAGRIEGREVPAIFERIADTAFETSIRLETEAEAETEDDESRPPMASSTASVPISGTNSESPSEKSDAPPSPIGTPELGTSELRSARLVS